MPDGSLFVMVADGMGGHAAGEVASGLAVRVVSEVVEREEGDPRQRLYDGFVEANRAIMEEARASRTRGMGTTGLAALLRGSNAYVAQIGDSRLYHFRDGRLVFRTTDHTRVQMLVDEGQITAEQARLHPEAGMLTRALGHARMADGQPLAPEVFAEPIELAEGDALLLSSDGMHDLLDDDEIAEFVAGRSAEDATRALVEEALARGGHDNITCVVVVAGKTAAARRSAPLPVSAEPARAAPPPPLGTATLAPAMLTPEPAPSTERAPSPKDGPDRRMAVMLGAAGVVVLALGFVLLTGAGVLTWWLWSSSP